jgi:hypothetical protein
MTVNHGVLGSSPRGGAQREKSKRFLSFFCFSPLCFSKHINRLKNSKKNLKKNKEKI